MTSSLTPADMDWHPPQRFHAFSHWLSTLTERYALDINTVHHASADAGFRRYFRIHTTITGTDNTNSSDSNTQNDNEANSYIIMDAPPEHGDCNDFVRIAKLLQLADIPAARVLEWDQTNGFILLPDLGTHTLLQTLQEAEGQADSSTVATMRYNYFLQAIDLLISWQLASKPNTLPAYDAALLERELSLFPDWYIARHRQYVLKDSQRLLLQKIFQILIDNNLQAAPVFVHRDYMPRNLMVRPSGSLAMLDFQDAVYGPITYDIASLLRDAFVSWEEEFVIDMAVRYWERAKHFGLPVEDDFGTFYQQLEWMGLQRHLKIAGIFARLSLRDDKPQYLKDTPRFIHYIRSTAGRYAQLRPLLPLLDDIEGATTQTAYSFGRM